MVTKFFKCPHCGNVIVKVVDSSVVPVCCGEEMTLLEPRMGDAATEKHVPAVQRMQDGTLCVKVGVVPHPMLPEHHVCFIAAETAGGIEVHYLEAGKPAETTFCDCKNEISAVYEYCSLHGLWVARTW